MGFLGFFFLDLVLHWNKAKPFIKRAQIKLCYLPAVEDSYHRLSDKLRIAKLPKYYFVSSKHLKLLVVQNIRTQCLYCHLNLSC